MKKNRKILIGAIITVVAFSSLIAASVNAAPGSPLSTIGNIVKAIAELFERVTLLENKTEEIQGCFVSEEICNGIDEPDCFGMTEADLIQMCGSDEGECHKGVQLCESGAWGPCIGEISPESEVCDGLDNDCDGMVDEGCGVPSETDCDDGFDNDGDGYIDCDDDDCYSYCGGIETICNDGLDNDADGTTDCDDNDCSGDPYCQACLDGEPCDDGDPQTTDDICVGGVCVGTPSCIPEVCDNLDNDCDGQVDEGNPGGGGNCNTGLAGVCAAGTEQCVSGAIQCVQNNYPVPEVCDGLDNDCDGMVDEGVCSSNGESCNAHSECLSGNCVDNVCCDTSCGGTCEACVASKTGGSDGTCDYITIGTDPDNECLGSEVCDGSGTCTSV